MREKKSIFRKTEKETTNLGGSWGGGMEGVGGKKRRGNDVIIFELI